MTTTINITSKRKPSRALIMRTLAEYIERGHKDMELLWGENYIGIFKHGNTWMGDGWIKEIGGNDIAQELNGMQKQAVEQFYDFLKDHVTISFVK